MQGWIFLPPPWGCFFPETLCNPYQASPNGAKDHSQGIHPLVNKAKFAQAPTGRQKINLLRKRLD